MFFNPKKTIPESYLNGKRIGIIGLAPGCGATHIAVAISNYLSEEEKKRVFLLEQNRHDDLRPLIEHLGSKTPDQPFTYHRVTYVPSCPQKGNLAIPELDGGCVVFDCGCEFKNSINILQLCDIKIVVGTDAVWRKKEYNKIRELSIIGDAGIRSGWRLFINLGDTRRMKEKAVYGLTVCCFPFEPAPVFPGRETITFLKEAIYR